jgi:hypothetical protein
LVAKLRTQWKDELDKYFLEPSDLQCLAMIVNSVMLTTGLPMLRVLGHGVIVDCSLSIFKEKLLEGVTCSFRQQQQVAFDGGDRCDKDGDSH